MTVSFIVGQIVIGWLAADFIGGVIHWLQDRVLTDRLRFVASGRLHHRKPLAFSKKTFLHRNLGTWLASVAVIGAWFVLFGASIALAASLVGGCVTAMVHYWTHLPRQAPKFVRVLQEVGVIQSPKQHAGHHRPPSTSRYCPLTDLLNPILDEIELWSRLERLLRVKAPR